VVRRMPRWAASERELVHASQVDVWEANGRRFEIVRASDVIRDGMTLELTDLDEDHAPGPALEIFRSDVDGSFTFSAHRAVDIPIEIVSRFVDAAMRSLPPTG
jgi:hypothetical protein